MGNFHRNYESSGGLGYFSKQYCIAANTSRVRTWSYYLCVPYYENESTYHVLNLFKLYNAIHNNLQEQVK